MADSRAREILSIGDKMFANKTHVDSLWEEIALQFYPERADFLTVRSTGDEYSDHLFTSVPSMARRELGNMLSAALRPRSQKWFSIHVGDDDTDDVTVNRKFLEFLSDIQWRAMYEADAGFVRATNQADHDFVTFGNAVLKVGLNAEGNSLLFKNYHLRDCAWSENEKGRIDVVHRNWKATARQLKTMWPDKVSDQVTKASIKDPDKEFDVRHVVVPSVMFEQGRGTRKPFMSLFVEREQENVLEAIGIEHFPYIVPRWHTIAGSVYGVSMSTAILLPDGRTMQAVMRTIRESGEKFVDPPMIAVSEAIRGDLALYAGGVTTADMEYDERLGDVLRPINQDRSGMPIGIEIAESLQADIAKGFFLDKLALPDTSGEKTAFEVRRLIEEQIRGQSPIFEPIEQDYNDPLCESVFELLRSNNAFPMENMPEGLQGSDIRFSFRSPLADLSDQNEAETYLDIMQRIVIPAAQIDPAQLEQVNLTKSTRDAMRSAGWKADWFKEEGAVDERRKVLEQQAAQQAQVEQMAQAAGIAEQGGKAAEAIAKADDET